MAVISARGAEAGQHLGRRLDAGREHERVREVIEVAGGRGDVARGPQAFQGLPSGIGASKATGRPRSVISIVSPRSTRRSSSLARWRSSTRTDVICYL